MQRTIRRWLIPPEFVDADKTSTARLLYIILFVLFVASSVAIGVYLIFGAIEVAQPLTLSWLPLLLALWLTRRGDLHGASLLLLFDMVGLATFLLIRGDGLQDIAILLFPAVIIVASLLVRWRAYLLIVGLSILALGLVAWGQMAGWVQAYGRPPLHIFVDFIMAALILSVMALIVSLLASNLRRSLTRARQNEQALAASEAQYRMLIEQAPDGILIVDTHEQVNLANPAACQLLQYSETELLGANSQRLFESTSEDQSTRLEDQFAAPLSGDTARNEHNLMRKDGSLLPVSSSGRQMLDGCYQYIFQDITARQQAAAERERLIKELEAKNTELERFTYTVSHDLKSPLITIAGYLGLLERDAQEQKPEQLRHDAQRIRDAVEKMNRLLTELLELSRIGRLMNPASEVPFEALVREALSLVQGRLVERGVHVEIAAGLPRVYGDRARLVEVVQNLVDNAAKFMGSQPEPRIAIGRRPEPAHEGVVFFVQDNGLGIEPQFHAKVFDLFSKLDARSDGTGIGLALVKRIVEVHGGRIWVESAGADQGSTFCFTLPVKPARPY